MRVLELAATAADTRRRSIFDAEKFRFEQRLDDRRAIDGDKRRPPPPAQLVDLTRHEFFAGSAFAFYQCGKIRRGDPLDPLADQANRTARSNQRRRTIAPALRTRQRPSP